MAGSAALPIDPATTRRFAVPVGDGQLCLHFGHCAQFALVDVDVTTGQITGTTCLPPPAHDHGVIPRWLRAPGATTIMAGGMGTHAQQHCAAQHITVVTGAPVAMPDALVTGTNACGHSWRQHRRAGDGCSVVSR